MFQLDKTIVSEDIIKNDFVCNLSACKGACCIDGDAGAPLETEEVSIMDEIYPKVKPYLRKDGIEAIEEQGTSILTIFDEHETPLIDGADCAYVIFDKDNKAICAIEQAYYDGVINWKKPVSCHLYPIRVKEYSKFTAINYDKWDICDDACTLGKSLKVPVYRFVKEALIRKFGAEWYEQLEKVAESIKE